MANTLELTTDLTTEDIESGEPNIMLKPVSWKILAALVGDEGVVLTSADGDVFIGEVSDWDEDYGYLTIDLV